MLCALNDYELNKVDETINSKPTSQAPVSFDQL